jgi:hypothetical protein
MDAYVRLFCVCAVLCAGSGLATSKESYRLCKNQETEKAANVQQRAVGCRLPKEGEEEGR